MNRIFLLFRNVLALIGLLALIGHTLVFMVLMVKMNLSPIDLTKKFVNKGISFLVPGMKLSGSQKRPVVNLDLFEPVDLSPHVTVKPVDERLLYSRRVLRVGPNRDLRLPSEAAKIAKPQDIIEIDAGVYVGDVAMWNTSDIKIRGVGGRAILDAGNRSMANKAIWVVRGNNVFIENIGFKNCKVRDRNGAGIRVEGDNLSVRNSLFLVQ